MCAKAEKQEMGRAEFAKSAGSSECGLEFNSIERWGKVHSQDSAEFLCQLIDLCRVIQSRMLAHLELDKGDALCGPLESLTEQYGIRRQCEP